MKQQNWFIIQKVHSKVYALAEFNHWQKVVSYLVLGKSGAALIDSGMGYGNILKEAVRKITNLPVKLLLTHGHWDHIGGMNEFGQVWLFNDEYEKKLVEKGFVSEGIGELNNTNLFKKPFKPREYKVKGKSECQLLVDGDKIQVGDEQIQIIHTPGHTPGSVCFRVKRLDLLFVGDTLYPGPIYVHLLESDFGKYYKSIKKLSKLVSKTTKIFPGHNEVECGIDLVKKVYNGCEAIKKEKVMVDLVDQEAMEYKFDGFSILKKA